MHDALHTQWVAWEAMGAYGHPLGLRALLGLDGGARECIHRVYWGWISQGPLTETCKIKTTKSEHTRNDAMLSPLVYTTLCIQQRLAQVRLALTQSLFSRCACHLHNIILLRDQTFWHQGAKEPRKQTAPRNHGANKTGNQGTKSRGTKETRNQGTKDPRIQGAEESDVLREPKSQ